MFWIILPKFDPKLSRGYPSDLPDGGSSPTRGGATQSPDDGDLSPKKQCSLKRFRRAEPANKFLFLSKKIKNIWGFRRENMKIKDLRILSGDIKEFGVFAEVFFLFESEN